MIQLAFALVLSQSPAQAPLQQPPPVDCADSAHRAFDFWVGDWHVTPTGSATVIAHSQITVTANGCAIEEDFRQTVGPGAAPTDYRGRSFTVHDPATAGWQQFYIDSTGQLTHFHGTVVDGAMVLDAPGLVAGVTRRMTIAALADGSVRQWGQRSTDGGITWSEPTYDFTYRRSE